jgi:hypothetical protein
LNRRPFPPIEQPKLYPSRIGHPAHNPVHCVDLADEMPFAQTTYRGITGHDTDAVTLQRDKRRLAAQPRSRAGGFGTRMAPANNDDIK